MADPVNISRLEAAANEYCVFEPNQVLTHAQLNGVAAYLNRQDRLSRLWLTGVGVIGGLAPSIAGASVQVTRGLGLTTDGDLATLPADAVFTHFRPYAENSPKYQPLMTGATRRAAFELLRSAETGPGVAPLATLPSPLAGMVAVALVETVEHDPDLCTGPDCDNVGKRALDGLRILLVSRADAEALRAPALTALSDTAANLPFLSVLRASVGKDTLNTTALAAAYNAALAPAFAESSAAFGTLQANAGGLLRLALGADPIPTWKGALETAQASVRGANLQYLHDFVRDIADAWNELRAILLDSDALLMPAPEAAPKHLLLGALSNPAELRSRFRPSPALDPKETERAVAAVRRLDAIVRSFQIPDTTATGIRITPSRAETERLGTRAVPFYYSPAVADRWYHRLLAGSSGDRRRGYSLGSLETPSRRISAHDFLRIEGHVGMRVKDAMETLKSLIATHRLPFALRAVLVHNERSKVVIRPPIRFTPLHRFHSILRKDVEVQLQEAAAFNTEFSRTIEAAVSSREIADVNVAADARTRRDEVTAGTTTATAALSTSRFTTYKKNGGATGWSQQFKSTLNAAASLKKTMGDHVRTDIPTPFDQLATNNHASWLDWIELHLKSIDDNEDDKLLLSKFSEEHPGLEHSGGVKTGGTFVVLYDDREVVVGAVALPYFAPEIAEPEPPDVPLPAPDFKLPEFIKGGAIFRPTIRAQLNDFENRLRPQWQTEIAAGKDSIKLAFETFKGTRVGPNVNLNPSVVTMPDFTDITLGSHMNRVAEAELEIIRLNESMMKPQVTDPEREALKVRAKEAETRLVESISKATEHLAKSPAAAADAAD
ncbi:MAG: hypothetical protein ACOYN0_16170, partial [Phycisphaerales bacterium]